MKVKSLYHTLLSFTDSSLSDSLASSTSGSLTFASAQDDMSIILEFARAIRERIAELSAASSQEPLHEETGIFESALTSAIGGPLSEVLAFLRTDVWGSIASVMELPVSLGDLDLVRDAVAGLQDTFATLADFTSLEDAFSGFGFIGEAKKSLEALLSTLSNVGRTIAQAVKGGVDGVVQLEASTRSTFESLKSVALSSVVTSLPVPAAVESAMRTLGEFGPLAIMISDVLGRMVTALPPSADNVTLASGSLAALSGDAAAALLLELRKLPVFSVLDAHLHNTSALIARLPYQLPRLADLVGAGTAVSTLAGAQLVELAAPGSALPFPFATSAGVTSMISAISARIVPALTSAAVACNETRSVLVEYQALATGAVPETLQIRIDAASAALSAAKTLLSTALSTASAMFSDLRGVIDAVTQREEVATGFDVLASIAELVSDTTVSILGRARDLVTLAHDVGLLSSPAISVSATLDVVASALPGVFASVSSFPTTSFTAVKSSIDGGALARLNEVESVILAVSGVIESGQAALRSVTEQALPHAVVKSMLDSPSQMLRSVPDLLDGLVPTLANSTCVRTALSSISRLASSLVSGAVAASDMAAMPHRATFSADALAATTRLIRVIQDALPPGFSNAVTVVADVKALASVLTAAGDLFWLLRGTNMTAIDRALREFSSLATYLREELADITAVEVLYSVALTATGSSKAGQIGAVALADQFDLVSSAGRSTVLDAVSAVMPTVERLGAVLQRVRDDVSSRAAGDPSLTDTTRLSNDINTALASGVAAFSTLQSAVARTSSVIGTFSGVSFTSLTSTITTATSAVSRGGTSAFSALSSLRSLALKVRAIEAMVPVQPMMDALLGITEMTLPAAQASADLIRDASLAGVLALPAASASLTSVSLIVDKLSALLSLLQLSQTFYSSATERDSPDAAEALLNKLDGSFEATLSSLRSLNGTAGIAAAREALQAFGAFLTSTDALVRLRTSLKIDIDSAVTALVDSPALLRSASSAIAQMLETFGLPFEHVLSTIGVTTDNALLLQQAFTTLQDLAELGPSGLIVRIEQSRTAFDALEQLRHDLPEYRAAASRINAALRPTSPGAKAASLEPASVDAVLAALSSAVVAVSLSTQPADAVHADALARLASPNAPIDAKFNASETVALRLLASSSADAAAALTGASRALAFALAGPCAGLSAFGDASALYANVFRAHSSLRVFNSSLATFLGLMTEVLHLIGSIPQLTTIAGATSAASTLFRGLLVAVPTARTVSMIALPSDETAAAMNATVFALCDKQAGFVVHLTRLADVLHNASSVYMLAVNSTALRARIVSLALTTRLASARDALLASVRIVGDSYAVAGTLDGARALSLATLAAATLTTPPTMAAADIALAATQSAGLAAKLPALLAAIGVSSGPVDMFLRGVTAIKRISSTADWVQALYSRVTNSGAVKRLVCMVKTWLSDSGPTGRRLQALAAMAWTVNGNAQLNGSAAAESPFPLRLTSSAVLQRSSMFTPVGVSWEGFSVNFSFSIASSGSTRKSGGEGLVFVLHNDARGTSAVGDAATASNAACMGFCGIRSSWGVRFDAMNDNFYDSSVGVVTGGRVEAAAGEIATPYNFGDGITRIGLRYQRAADGSGRMRLFVAQQTSAVGRLVERHSNYVLSKVPDLFAAMGCDAASGSCSGFAGFTAATGSTLTASHYINWFSAASGVWVPQAQALAATPASSGTPARTTSATGSQAESRSATRSSTASRSRSPSGTVSQTFRNSSLSTRTSSASRAATRSASGTLQRAVSVSPTSSSSGFAPSFSPAYNVPRPEMLIGECGDSVGAGALRGMFDDFSVAFTSLASTLRATFSGVAHSANSSSPSLCSTAAVYAALDFAESSLGRMGELAGAIDEMDALGWLQTALKEGADSLSSAIEDDVDAVGELLAVVQSRLVGDSASVALLGPIMEPLNDLTGLLASLGVTSHIAQLLPTIQSALSFAAPDLSPVTGLLRSFAKQSAVVRVLRKLLPVVDSVCSGVNQLRTVGSFFRGVVSSGSGAPSNAGLLSSLTRFKRLLPDVSTMFTELRGAFANASSSALESSTNVTWLSRANNVIATLNRTLVFVGNSVASIGPITERVKVTLDSLASFAQSGLPRLAERVTQGIETVRAFRFDPDVVEAGLSGVVGSLVDNVVSLSSLPRLFASVSELAATPVSPVALAPISSMLNSVGQLSGLSSIFTSLSSILTDAGTVIESVDALAKTVARAGQSAKSAAASSITTVLSGFSSGVQRLTGAIREVRAYLNSTSDTGTAKLRAVFSLISNAINSLPDLDDAFTQIGELVATVEELVDFGRSGLPEVAAAAIRVVNSVRSVTAGLSGGASGANSSSSSSTNNGLGVGSIVSSAFDGLTPVLDAFGSVGDFLGDAWGFLVKLPGLFDLTPVYGAINTVRDLVTSVTDMVEKLNVPLDFLPEELTAALRALGINSTDASSLFKSGAQFFKFVLNLKDASFGLRPLLGMLADSRAVCPASGATPAAALAAVLGTALDTSPAAASALSSNASAPSPGTVQLDAIQCAGVWAAGANPGTANATRISVASAYGDLMSLDLAPCFGAVEIGAAGLSLPLLFGGSSAPSRLNTLTAIANPLAVYTAIKASLPALSISGASAAALAAAPPPLPGLGFCFTPSITAGPCFVLRTRLAAMLSGVNDGIGKIQLAEPLAVKGLTSVFGPILTRAVSTIASTVLPILGKFINGAVTFGVTVLNAIGIDLTPAAGRNLLAQDSHEQLSYVREVPRMASALDALHAHLIEQAAAKGAPFQGRVLISTEVDVAPGVSRRLQLSMTLLFSILDTVVEFIDDGQQFIVETGSAIIDKLPLDTVITAVSAFESVAKPVKQVFDGLSPWIRKILGSSASSDELMSFLGLGDQLRSVSGALKPILEMFTSAWSFMKEGMGKFLPEINSTINMIDGMYAQGKAIFLKWWDIDEKIERWVMERVNIGMSGKTTADLVPWGSLPYCSELLCMRQETRAGEAYGWLFPVRYMQFWDLSSPPLISLGGEKIMSWTIGGLYEWYRPGGVGFYGQDFVMVCYQGLEDKVGSPSVLAFYPRTSRQIYKLVELWIDESTPFTGTCGGVALARDVLYVTDDTDQEGWLLGYSKVDIDALLDAGRAPGSIFVTSDSNKRLIINLPFTASHVYYDNDPINPRLWVSEHYRNATVDEPTPLCKNGRSAVTSSVLRRQLGDTDESPPTQANVPDSASEAQKIELDSCADIVRVSRENNQTADLPPFCCKYPAYSAFSCNSASATPPGTASSSKSASATKSANPSVRAAQAQATAAAVAQLRVRCNAIALQVAAGAVDSNGAIELPEECDGLVNVTIAKAPANATIAVNVIERAKLVSYTIDSFTGVPTQWSLGSGKPVLFHDVEINIGPDVKSAVFGFREYTGGPQYIILNRCPIRRGSTCKLEFHEIPKSVVIDKAAASATSALLAAVTRPKVVKFTLEVGTGAKAKSAKNGGVAMKDAAPDVGATITLVNTLRIPSAARGISYEPQVSNGNTVVRHLGIVFSGCSQPDHNKVSLYGLDCEDQLRISTFPVLRAFGPNISSNQVYARVLNVDVFKPRCIIPLASMCPSLGARKGKNSKKGNPPRKSRTLLYTDVSSHDGSAHRDSYVRSFIARREVHAVEQSPSQREARAALPLPFGRTVLPAFVSQGGRRLYAHLDDLGSGRIRELQQAALPSARVMPDSRFESTYGRLYGSLWYGDGQLSHPTPRGGNVTSSALVVAAADARRLQADLGDLAPQGESDGCLAGSMMLYEKAKVLFEQRSTQIIVIIPVTFKIQLTANFRVDIGGALCIDKRQITISLIPSAVLSVSASASIDLGVVYAGVGIEADIMAIALVVSVFY